MLVINIDRKFSLHAKYGHTTTMAIELKRSFVGRVTQILILVV